jgi:NAD(P)-dependent dehydrogenase (short-subunit alcohol dehydrogenase family)
MTKQKVALVTGASSGIGRATAVTLAGAGYAVAVLARRRDALSELARQAPIAFADVCDVRDAAAVESYFAAMLGELGRLDVVFNNAGVTAPAANFGDVTLEDWQRVLQTNLFGSFNVARCAFRQMRAQTPQGGRIINNGSVSAYVPRPHSAAYTASKHAITGLTKSISLDGRPYAIACGQIDIGNAATDATAKMSNGVLQADGRQAPEPTFPVQHAADAVLYMANLPLEANVQFMTVMATTMPYVGRG